MASASSWMPHIVFVGAAVSKMLAIALKILTWWYCGIGSPSAGVCAGSILISMPNRRFGRLFYTLIIHWWFGTISGIFFGIPLVMIVANPSSSSASYVTSLTAGIDVSLITVNELGSDVVDLSVVLPVTIGSNVCALVILFILPPHVCPPPLPGVFVAAVVCWVDVDVVAGGEPDRRFPIRTRISAAALILSLTMIGVSEWRSFDNGS
jgi:hypothetical protein